MNNGGSEKQAVQLANSLVEKYNVTILIYYGDQVAGTLLSKINDSRIRLIRLNGSALRKVYDILSIFIQEDYDVVFSYLLLPSFLGGVLGRIAGVPYTIGGIRSSKIDQHKVLLNKLIQNYVNYLTIYNNYEGVEKLSALGFNKNKAYVIPNCHESGIDAIVREDHKIKEILSVGRFHFSKDYKTALQAISYINNKQSIRYTIVGYGELHGNICKWVEEFELKEFVQIVIKPDNLDYYYRKADIFLQTSKFEGLSNTVMEAMSYSLPVVTTKVGDNGKLVSDGVSGYLCEPGDCAGISNSLEELIDDYSLRLAMGAEGYSILNANYTMPIFRKRYFDFISMLNG